MRLARDGASRLPTGHDDPPTIPSILDRLGKGGGKRRSSAIDLRPSTASQKSPFEFSPFSDTPVSSIFNGTRGEARRGGAHDSSCSMRQRHFVINGPREMYPADYLKFKCRARHGERMNQPRVRTTTNRGKPPLFFFGVGDFLSVREELHDPSEDAIKLVISPAALPPPPSPRIIDRYAGIIARVRHDSNCLLATRQN